MRFWSGNRSLARRHYEMELLELLLMATAPQYGPSNLFEDRTDYARAEDEADIFNRGIDATVTVLGNPKFADRDKLVVNRPIANGMLGHRILVVREEDAPAFAAIRTASELKAKVAGIPATWADVAIYEANGCAFVEKGTFEEIFVRLRNGEFDYFALGAFEIQDVFEAMARPVGGLAIETSLLLQYPMPLVFYVHPRHKDLACRIELGLNKLRRKGLLKTIFARHFGDVLAGLSIEERRILRLKNPLL